MATNVSAVVSHVINYQQLTVEHENDQSLDRKFANSSVETFCHAFRKIFTLTRLPNLS